jgi:hypothetical protein
MAGGTGDDDAHVRHGFSSPPLDAGGLAAVPGDEKRGRRQACAS